MLGSRDHIKGKKQTKQNSIRATHHRMVMVSKSLLLREEKKARPQDGPKSRWAVGGSEGAVPQPPEWMNEWSR